MSRLRRLKDRKRKQFIKTTMGSLALTIVIGTMQSTTTYAWFTDKELIDNDLTITMGKLDVEIGPGFNGDTLKFNEKLEKSFNIENRGTLKQNLSIGLQMTNDISEDVLGSIKYEIKLKHNGKELPLITKTIKELTQNRIEIKDNNGKEITLNTNEKLECIATVIITDKSKFDVIAGNQLNFKLEVLAKQIGYSNAGFSDLDIQKNLINIEKKELEPGETETVFGKCTCCGNNGVTLNYSKYVDKDYINKIYAISLFGESGDDMYTAHIHHKNGDVTLVKNNQTVGRPITPEEVLRKEFKVDFSIDGRTDYLRYLLTFRKDTSGNIVAKWTKVGFVSPFNENEEQLNEEVQALSEPMVEEDIKEEINEQMKPDVVEPPSESEIVETPKVEEVVVPSQPDTIAPSKEETEIQE